jgi:predicted DNA-binding helix-hairpin-helix protein
MFPLEVNRATREELLRIPGIGPRAAERIIQMRRDDLFRHIEDLREAGIVAPRAAPFVSLNGCRPPRQLPLL